MQKEREFLLKESAENAQALRDQQLTNMRMMEAIDNQVDKSFELRQHIEFIRKDLLDQRRRQNQHIGKLEELYRKRDSEIRDLAKELMFAKKTRSELETRRD